MARPYEKRFSCTTCGYVGPPSPDHRCPNCGKRAGGLRRLGRRASLPAAGLVLLAAALLCFHLFHPRVAAEFSRLFAPAPKRFHIGLDVSANVDRDALEKIKDHLTLRLRGFVGDPSISYRISTFGNPGCGREAILPLVATTSPATDAAFRRAVAEPLAAVAAAPIAPRRVVPLTTPFYGFLESVLVPDPGTRVIIFTDLMNDDGDCRERFGFPAEAIARFGADGTGELYFLYTPPRPAGDPRRNRMLADQQREFIQRMTALAGEGRVRVFFRRIPEDPVESLLFIRRELSKALPSTLLASLQDRLSRLFEAAADALGA